MKKKITIIGLGNPGDKYENTRHNAGKMLVEFLENGNYTLMYSTDYMNNSGDFVRKQKDYYKVDLENLYIAHDDLDIPLGEYKITKKPPKIHNGVNSVTEALGSDEYWKIRIGIDNRDPENRTPGEAYVLENFNNQEFAILEKVFKDIEDDLSS